MSVITDPANIVEDFITRFKTEGEHLLADIMPVIHGGATKLDELASSKITAEVEALVAPLDPADEEIVAGLIRSFGAKAARIAELTAPPAETPAGVDAEPEPPAA